MNSLAEALINGAVAGKSKDYLQGLADGYDLASNREPTVLYTYVVKLNEYGKSQWISAVKRVRTVSECGLREAKEAIELGKPFTSMHPEYLVRVMLEDYGTVREIP